MTNTCKLKGRIIEKGYTLEKFAKQIDLSRPALRKRISNEVDFKVSEIEKIMSALDIPRTEVAEYFFVTSVPKMER